jgi:hypothetical protein
MQGQKQSVRSEASAIGEPLSPVVREIGAMHFEGNVVPHGWFQHPLLQHESGKANLVAITLLADVVYWYRPTVLRDEVSGCVVEVRQKFAADKLQKSYQAWADLFGLTKRQVQDAITFLKQRRILRVELRDVPTVTGAVLRNVVFIEPVPEMIRQLTDVPTPETATSSSPASSPSLLRSSRARPAMKGDTCPVQTGYVPRCKGTRISFHRGTNTETNSTKTSTKTTAAAEKGRSAPVDIQKRRSGSAAAVEEENEEIRGLIASLLAAEVNRADAIRLARDRPEECRRQLEYLPFVSEFTSGKGAYLRTAIEQGFGPAKGWHREQKRQQALAKRTAAVQIQEQRKEQDQERMIAVQSLRTRMEHDPVLWSQITAEAERQLPAPLRGKSGHVAYRPTLEARINEIVAERIRAAP